MAYDRDAARRLLSRVALDRDGWREQGIDISLLGVDEDTGTLSIGVRSPTADAVGPLRERYGKDTRVEYADIRPGPFSPA